VGTEALALANMEKNRKEFGYPETGFVAPIEHSLLYAIISSSGTTDYPADVMEQQIADEDFDQYLLVVSKQTTSSNSSHQEEQEPIISYAQLSALLALSAENLPAPEPEKNNKDTTTTTNDNTKQQQQETQQKVSVGQKLCKALLKCVIRHAEEHGLDRQHEVQEFLRPVQVYTSKREAKAAFVGILPMYLGYAATIVTANPVPMLLGASVSLSMSDKTAKERDHVEGFASETNRRGDVEKASLLDEGEDFEYGDD